MNPLLTFAQLPWAQSLGWTLVHFLWQGALLGLLAWSGLALLRGASARARYGLACAFLLLMVATPGATFLWLQAQAPGPLPPAQLTAGTLAGLAPAPSLAARLRSAGEPILPWLLAGWALGVLLLSARFLGGWVRVHQLRRRDARPVPAEWHLVLSRLCRELKLSRTVRLLQSAAVEVPTALGWLRPLILLPACAFTGLAPLQLEAVLAHELAHIRRGDFLVNLLQSLVEVLLFYHPAVWWLSARIRTEREHCCDDVAAELCGDPLLLARALTDLEALREAEPDPTPKLALAATGGSLMHRIRHLLHPALPASSAARTTALALLAASLLGAGVVLQDQGKEAAPAEKRTRMKVVDGDRRLDLQMEGEVRLDAAAQEPVAVPGEGRFRVEEKKGGKTRAYAVTKGQRTYTVDGKEQPLDAEGEAWLRGAVKDAAKARAAQEKARRVEIRTHRLGDQTRELDAHLKDLDVHLRELDRLPELSREERAKVRADLDKARAELEKAQAERRKVQVEVLTEDEHPGSVIIRKRVDGKEVVEKRVKVRRPRKEGEEGSWTFVGRGGEGGETWTFAGPGDEEGVTIPEREIHIPPIHIPEIRVPHPAAAPDPQAEIRALQSAMKSLQKRLDQLQKQMAETPKPAKGRPSSEGLPTPPPPPPAPEPPPAPPVPPVPPPPPADGHA